MAVLTPKQREIADRERLILDVGRRLLIDHGLPGLSMDRIAEAIDYSKGTVYQHFSSKEDVVAALFIETLAKRTAMFQRAAAFRGTTRERVTAIGVADRLFVTQHPDHFRIENLADLDAVFAKTSVERQESRKRIKRSMMEALDAIVADAVAAGDLSLPDEVPYCQTMYGLWTLSVGHHTLENSRDKTEYMALRPGWLPLWNNYLALLDGYGWAPLSQDWDYVASRDKIVAEVFPEFDRHAADFED
ncbi:MAG: helix-turn-helix domain-containing protein [Planctomycetota bacterium]